ncbi:ABC transporter ATP-binding protein [Candidatus Woesearchaeota archaeon]|nr:ABC transporter ATP-binding protein [Candidatus Woesearchaeota archaeon]
MAAPIFKVVNVTKVFGKNIVLKNINLEVQAGEILGIIGASGSGKTTLLRTLVGFYKPENGEVLFRIKPVIESKTASFQPVSKMQTVLKHLYGFAPQEHSFYEKLTVKENLEYFASLYNLEKQEIKANIDSLLEFMGLKQFKNMVSEKLSGGMARRLDIACSLVHEPAVLILDEPTADLDPLLRKHILWLVKKINEQGTTIIIASHNLKELETLCHRIAFLHNGRIITVGTPQELKARFSNKKTIRVESHPGRYESLIQELKSKLESSGVKFEVVSVEGTELVIETRQVDACLKQVLKVFESFGETIIDLKIEHPSLDDIFVELTRDLNKKV